MVHVERTIPEWMRVDSEARERLRRTEAFLRVRASGLSAGLPHGVIEIARKIFFESGGGGGFPWVRAVGLDWGIARHIRMKKDGG